MDGCVFLSVSFHRNKVCVKTVVFLFGRKRVKEVRGEDGERVGIIFLRKKKNLCGWREEEGKEER